MIQVTFGNRIFECARAVKGVNYIRLYDSNNIQTAAFEEVVDFSAFTVEGGQWERGKSSQRVTAKASQGSNGFILDIEEKAIIEDGLTICFEAPTDNSSVTNVEIDSIEYPLVTSGGVGVEAIPNCFELGAKLEIMLCINQTRSVAYLQTGLPMMGTRYPINEGVVECDNGDWNYTMYSDGTIEAWTERYFSVSSAYETNPYLYASGDRVEDFPFDLDVEKPIIYFPITHGFPALPTGLDLSFNKDSTENWVDKGTGNIGFTIFPASYRKNDNVYTMIYVKAHLK